MKQLSRLFCLLLLASVTVVLPSSAHAGVYTVKSCMEGNGPGSAPALGVYSSNAPSKFQDDNSFCGAGSYPFIGWGIFPKRTATPTQGDLARVKFSAPSGLRFVGVSFFLETDGTMAAIPGGWEQNYFFHNNGTDVTSVTPFTTNTLPSGVTRQDFEVNQKCTTPTCTVYQVGRDGPRTDLENVVLSVQDSVQPRIFQDGTLFAGGVQSGNKTVEATGADGESGVAKVVMVVNSTYLGVDPGTASGTGVSCDPSAPSYNSYRPCTAIHQKTWSVNTAAAPFTNGLNSVTVCSIDYSGNTACLPGTWVYVQN